MNADGHFDEDDLVLYALRLLPEEQQAVMARRVAESHLLQERLTATVAALGGYAEATVEPKFPPAGSLDRMMQRIAAESRTPRKPALVPRQVSPARPTEPNRFAWPVLSKWTGLGIAALLLIAVGLIGQRMLVLRRLVKQEQMKVESLSKGSEDLRRERDAMQANLAEQRRAAAALQTEAVAAEGGAKNLQSKLADQRTQLNTQVAKTAEAEHEQILLQGTVAMQADQLAQLSSASRDAQVLAALTNPTALRVVLTKPKAKPAPTGRAAYIADKGTLVFLGNNLAPLRPSKVYELWLMPADGSSPIAAGTFLPDARGNATLAYVHFPRAVPAKGFSVTIEKMGGSQVPTLPLIIAGFSSKS